MITRREFLDALAVGAAGLAVGTTAKSYGRVMGSNDRLNFAVIGLNGRGYAHLAGLKANKSAARISHVCDVDSSILKKFADSVQREMGEAPVAEKDFRRILEQKDVDAITIATPDHWHAPMAIAGLQAGQPVSVEKRRTHEVDVCRWALGVDYPQRVTASGGRYQFKDDWQFYDTLVTSFEYEDRTLSWEGKSCQGMKYYGRDRGSLIMGTTGTVLVDRDGYEIYDLKGNRTNELKAGSTTSSADLTGRDSMTDAHFANFIAGIRKGEKLNAPVSVGNVAVTMLQLSNIAWEVNRELHLDTKDGRIQGDPEARKMCGP